jgi:cytochrome P450
MTVSTLSSLPLPPGDNGLPWIGETIPWAREPLRFARERYERHGLIWRTHLIGRPCVVMLGPEANRFILGTHMRHFSSRAGWGKSITSLIGDGLSLIDGAEHRRHRRMIQPALHGAMLERYFDVMQDLAVRHAERWARDGRLKLFDGFKHLSFDIAAELMLGARTEAERARFRRRFHVFTRGLFALPAWKLPVTPYGQAWRAGKSLREMLRTTIAARRSRPGDDILYLLLEARDERGVGFTDAELVDELLVLLWAGHDTVTSLLTWIIYELLRHPAVFEAAVAEQQQVVGDASLTLGHLRRLPVLDSIIREAERLHPPAPGGFRGVVEAFEYGGYRIPAGWTVMYSTVWTHHMPELWTEPECFDPARFLPPRGEGKKPYSLVGFGAGPRVCVGLEFARMQMRIVVSHLLRRYRFDLVPGQDFTPVPVPTKMPRDGLLVRVARR